MDTSPKVQRVEIPVRWVGSLDSSELSLAPPAYMAVDSSDYWTFACSLARTLSLLPVLNEKREPPAFTAAAYIQTGCQVND